MEVEMEKSSFRAVAQLIEPVFSSEYEGGVLELLLFRPGICGNVILLLSVFYIIAYDFSCVMEQIQRFVVCSLVLYRSPVFRQFQSEGKFRL